MLAMVSGNYHVGFAHCTTHGNWNVNGRSQSNPTERLCISKKIDISLQFNGLSNTL
jgi:hypothetical protein